MFEPNWDELVMLREMNVLFDTNLGILVYKKRRLDRVCVLSFRGDSGLFLHVPMVLL